MYDLRDIRWVYGTTGADSNRQIHRPEGPQHAPASQKLSEQPLCAGIEARDFELDSFGGISP